MKLTVILIFFGVLLTACTQATEVPTATNIPASTPHTIDFEVTFDGNGCTVSGPTEVPIGDYSFLFNNTSGRRAKLVVGQLLDGHTFQDLLDLQTEPGDTFGIEPWMSTPFYYTKDHKVYTVSLDEAGEHCTSISEYKHVGIWLCAPFQVIENLSE
jgi:hypothetical protein